MGCTIIFSPQAIEDLEAAVRFIAKDNPDAALRVGNALIDSVAILENFPLLGSPYAKRSGVRKLVSRPYLIFYRFREKENLVDILRYWHGAQREPNLRTLG
jgi:toxin ParE1/3/4